MGQAFERANGGFDQPMARLVVHIRDQAEAAGISLELWRIESAFQLVHFKSSGQIRRDRGQFPDAECRIGKIVCRGQAAWMITLYGATGRHDAAASCKAPTTSPRWTKV